MQVVVLNYTYEFLGFISWKRAINLVLAKKVEVIEDSDKIVRSQKLALFIPKVVRLLKFIRRIYREKIPFSRKNIFIRDNYTCQYCGKQERKRLTIDHVIPVSRGGKDTWENTVACCPECNLKKGKRLPSEVGMKLKRKPFQPTIREFLKMMFQALQLDIKALDFLK